MADAVETLLLQALNALQAQLDRLSREVYGNGSPGLKQAVAEAELTVKHIREMLENHQAADEEAHQRIDFIEGHVNTLIADREAMAKRAAEQKDTKKFQRDWVADLVKAAAIVLVTLGINRLTGG